MPHATTLGAHWTVLLAEPDDAPGDTERRLERALSAAEAVAWEWDVASGESRLCAGTVALLGLKDDPRDGFLDLVHPEDLTWLRPAMLAAARGQAPYDFEFRLLRPDGQVEWVRDRGLLERDADGRPRRLAGIAQLVTAQRRTEAAFCATFEQAAVGMAHVAPDGRFLRVNGQLCALLGRTRDTLLRLTFPEITHPDDLGADLAQRDALLEGRIATYSMEKRYLRPDGEVVWANLTGSLVRDATGAPDYFIAVVEDIAARKAAEAALHEREAQLHRALAGGRVFHFSWEPAADEVRRSPNCAALLGLEAAPDPTRDTGQDFFSQVHPDDRERFVATVTGLSPARPSYTATYRYARPDGGVAWLEESGTADFDPTGGMRRLAGITIDVTARKAAEAALAREAELRSLLLEVSHLILEGGRDEAALATLVFERVAPRLDADLCFNYRLNTALDALELVAGPGVPPGALEAARILRLGEAFCGTTAATRAPFTAGAEQVATGSQGTFVRSLGVRAYACHPLMGRDGALLGTFALATTRRDFFTPEEIGFLQALCDLLALAWQRLRTEAALAESERFVRGVLDALPEHIVVLDSTGVIVAVNAAWTRFNRENGGATAAVGVNYLAACRAACSSGDRGAREILEGLEDVLAGRRDSFTQAYPCHAPDRQRWYLMHAERPHAGTAGPRAGAVLSHLDITDLMLAERAAATTAARLIRAQRIGQVADFDIDLRDGILASFDHRSAEYIDLHGIAAHEAVERHEDWVRRLHPQDRARAEACVRHAVSDASGATEYAQQYRILTADGATRWISARGEIERDPATGRALRMVGAHVDVTGLKQAQAALAASEARFRALAESHPGIICETDASGRTTYTNRFFQQYTGFSADALLGDAWLAILHPADRPRAADIWNAAVHAGEAYEAEFRFRAADGTYRWFLCRGTPQHAPGGAIHSWHGAAVDITEIADAREARAREAEELERRVADRTRVLADVARELAAEMRRREQAQAALLQSQKMEALGQLTGNVAHDFNNILAAILGTFRLLERRVADPKLQELIRHGEQAGDRAAKLVAQLTAFARREELRPVLTDPGDLLRGGEDMICHTAGSRIRCHFEAAPQTWPVLVDPISLETVLLNLAANARDAMPHGGTLTISCRNALPAELPPGLAPERGHVVLSVADTGTGMDQRTLRRATEPFFTTKPRGKGTGLGLASAHGFAGQSGGALRLRSAPGDGTTVEIFLPRAGVLPTGAAPGNGAPPLAEEEAAQLDRTRHGAATLLVVDDDDGVRPVTGALLRELGYRVIEAPSAEAAEAMAHAEGTIDMLVTDVVMAGATGPVLAARLRAEQPDLPGPVPHRARGGRGTRRRPGAAQALHRRGAGPGCAGGAGPPARPSRCHRASGRPAA